MKKVAFFVLTIAICLVNADIIWDWSFSSESGQFVTNGDIADDNVAAGTYECIDFIVTASATGAEIGSLLDGTYTTIFATDQPLSFTWDGTEIAKWNHSGINVFDWWAFGSVDQGYNSCYFFGWDYGNVNNYKSAAHWSGDDYLLPALGQVLVTVHHSSVPEPDTMLLLCTGFLSLAGCGIRKKYR